MSVFKGVRFIPGMLVRRFCLALILGIVGCAAATTLAPMEPGFNLSGIWVGETRVIPCFPRQTAMGRCNAVNRITFAMQQDGSTISGDYKCAIGTAVCRDANKTTSGKIVNGTLNGGTIAMRVMLPGDVSSCIYNGDATSTAISGRYRCYEGGGLSEMGMWQVSRPGSTDQVPNR